MEEEGIPVSEYACFMMESLFPLLMTEKRREEMSFVEVGSN